MKIFVISSDYPPFHAGGYELRVKDIVDGLVQRGHDVQILTTKKSGKRKNDPRSVPYTVIRKLHNRYHSRFFPKEVLHDLMDITVIGRQVEAFQPDLIYLGHIYVLTKALIPYLADQTLPIVLDEGGASLKGAWSDHGRWFRFTGDYRSRFEILNMVKPLVVNLVCKLSKKRIKKDWSWPENIHVIFNNQQNYERIQALNVPLKGAQVIHSGLDTDKFTFKPRTRIDLPVQIIYPARIEPLKGHLDVLRLVSMLLESSIDVHLTFVGPGGSTEYEQKLRNEISSLNLNRSVTFLPMLSQDQLVELYLVSDILFFPTYHQMGFSRVPLEAMACGCVVISYGNEASDEIIRHGENGYLVEQENLQEVARIIEMLLSSPKKYEEMIDHARQEVEKRYSLEKYIDQVEETIRSVGA